MKRVKLKTRLIGCATRKSWQTLQTLHASVIQDLRKICTKKSNGLSSGLDILQICNRVMSYLCEQINVVHFLATYFYAGDIFKVNLINV